MSGLLRSVFTLIITAATLAANAQGRLKGTVTTGEAPVPFATVGFKDLKTGVVTDETGQFIIPNIPAGK
ncbi:carboxypeptidase-like regulatory domain-containing protein, partial [Chitinophaga sp.]|uniref:carboxypeptidase-like regulatory domain-containing protein n=1 Tax=Chitinophaga sp. TaxID=1869181 RepID=UPI002604FC8E